MTPIVPAVIPENAGIQRLGLNPTFNTREGEEMDPRTVTLGTDRWLTDSRVYNLVWLGRWIERAETVARVLKWAAEQDGGDTKTTPGLDEIARMAASVRGVTLETGESPLDALLSGDSGSSLRGCLAAARYNATHAAPVEVIQNLGVAISILDDLGGPPSSAAEVASLMADMLTQLDQLHQSIEGAWFHSEALSEEEVFRRFMQQ